MLKFVNKILLCGQFFKQKKLYKNTGDNNLFGKTRKGEIMAPVTQVTSSSSSNSSTGTKSAYVDREQAEKEKRDAEIKRQLHTKQVRKDAVRDASYRYQAYGTLGGGRIDDAELANKMAEDYVKNAFHDELSDATTVFYDKKEFQEAEKLRKQKYDEIYKEARDKGLSRKEARAEAESRLGKNVYLGKITNWKTRKYIEDHKDEFFDANGNFLSDKFKAKALGYANLHTKDGEVENTHLSLKERREAAEKEGVSCKVIKTFAKKSNLSYEKNLTDVYRGGTIVAAAGVGAGVGALIGGGIGATAVAGDCCAGAVAEATIPSAVVGAGTGATAGGVASGWLKDPGVKENEVYAPAERTQPIPGPDLNPNPVESEINVNATPIELDNPQPEVCELTPGEFVDETCTYKLKKGQSLYDAVRDGYGLKTHEEIMEYVHRIKDKYGISYKDNTPRTEWEMPKINGKNFNCDAKVTGTVTKYAEKQDGATGKFERTESYWTVDCKGNTQYYDTRAERDAAVEESKSNPKKVP